jgi:hypothetical protein
MAKLSFKQNQTHSSNSIDDIFARAEDSFNVERNTVLGDYQKYLKHLEDDSGISLIQGLEDLGIEQVTTDNDYPALRVGPAEWRTNLCRNPKSGINAAVRLAAKKYQRLEPNAHLSWFDPRTYAPGVLTSFENGRWTVYDWKNGLYQPSKSIVPQTGKTKTEGNRRYYFQSELHEQIKQYLIGQTFETSFLIVLYNDDLVSHYQRKIVDRREFTLEETWQALANDAEESDTKRKIAGGGKTTPSSVPASEEHKEFAKKLARLTTDHNVTFDAGTGGVSTMLFEASDPDKKADFLNGILTAKNKVKFLGYEKAPAK